MADTIIFWGDVNHVGVKKDKAVRRFLVLGGRIKPPSRTLIELTLRACLKLCQRICLIHFYWNDNFYDCKDFNNCFHITAKVPVCCLGFESALHHIILEALKTYCLLCLTRKGKYFGQKTETIQYYEQWGLPCKGREIKGMIFLLNVT